MKGLIALKQYNGSLFNTNGSSASPIERHTADFSNYSQQIDLQSKLLMDKYKSSCLDVKQLQEVLNVGESNAYEFLKDNKNMVRVIGRRKVVPIVLLSVYLVTGSSHISS